MSVLCEHRILDEVKVKLHRNVVRPTMLYESECQAFKKNIQCDVEKIQMLGWMFETMIMANIRNDQI